MYPPAVLTVYLGLATSVLAAPPQPARDGTAGKRLVQRDEPKQLLKVDLPPPDNWFVGERLFPNYTIRGYNSYLDDYTAASWGDYMLAQCQSTPDCTSVSAFKGRNDRYNKGQNYGDFQGEILWYGATYGGGPTTPGDYVRVDDYPSLAITDSQFWTVPAPKKLDQVLLAPGNHIAGGRLFPGNFITDYTAELSDWTAEGFNAYVLAECQATADCTSTAAYSSRSCFPCLADGAPVADGAAHGIVDRGGGGEDSYAVWVGVLYRGGPTSKVDYDLVDPSLGIADTQFWSIEAWTNPRA